MKRFSCTMFAALLVSVILSVFASEAEAKTCRLYPGQGGEKVFPGWPTKRVVILTEHEVRTLWVNTSCGKPEVKAEGVTYTVRFENRRDEYEVESGWRIRLLVDAGMVGKSIPITISGRGRSFTVTAKVQANPLVVATKASKKADEARDTADDARDVADEALKAKKRDVELVLSPMISLESPGHEGYGLGLGVNAILGKFDKKGQVQLGLSGRLSWHYYEQEVIGLAANSDVMASEFDGLAMFLLRWRPHWRFALEGSTGFGVRIFTHDDAVTLQTGELMIRGVEGRVAYHPIWAANVGAKLWLHKTISLGVQWGTTVSLTRQVQNPNAEGGLPDKGNVWNHFFLFNLGFSL